MHKFLLFLILFACVAAICCKNERSSDKSSSYLKAILRKNDSSFISQANNYSTFKKLFDKAGNPIPLSLAISVLKLDTNLNHDSEYRTIQAVQFSDSVIGFIFSFDCPAGGFCKTTELATFNSGHYVTSIDVGYELSDLADSHSLSYKIEKGTIYLHEEFMKNFETESGADSEVVTVQKMDTMLIDQASGNIYKK